MNKAYRILPMVLSAGLLFSGAVFAAGSDDFFTNDGPIDTSVLSDSTNIDPASTALTDATASATVKTTDTLDQIKADIQSKPSDDTLYQKAADRFNQNGDKGFKVFVHGSVLDFSKYDNVMPSVANGRTLIPIRAIAETLGAQVAWNPGTQEIAIVKDGKTVILKLNSDIASINGVSAKLDTPAVMVSGRTLIPLRFVSEAFGEKVGWYTSGGAQIISVHP